MADAPARAVVSLTLPFPPSGLSPNARLHFHEKRRIVASYRQSCQVDALNVRRDMERRLGMTFPLAVPVTMIVTFVLPTHQRRDWTNLIGSFKAGEDGLVDAGLLPDDSIQAIGRVGYEWRRGKAAVEVTLEGVA